MSKNEEQKDCTTWHSKPFITFFTLFMFLTMALSGLSVYFAPRGKIANWSDWSFLSINRLVWIDIHLTVSIIFIVLILFHLINNRKCLKGYIVSRMSGKLKLKRELFIASILVIYIVISAIYQIPPISYINELRYYLKNNHWSAQEDNGRRNSGWGRGRHQGGRGRGYRQWDQ